MGEFEVDLAALRREYESAVLEEDTASSDPWEQFSGWFADAVASPLVVEANAMVIATASADGLPSARTVLLKSVEPGEGFVFFTHTTSAKGRDLADRPDCALLFEWSAVQRQVRVAGRAELLTRDEVEAYFASRPRSARIGAWASAQSTDLTCRAELEEAYREAERRFGPDEQDGPVPVPETWGGYRVRPARFEFWQGRRSRLHDRIVYVAQPEAGAWMRSRLAP